MRMTYLWIFLIFFHCLGAQVKDNFDDGDIHTNPIWFGDLDHFTVDVLGKLRLNAPQSGQSYLFVPVNVPDSFELSLDVQMDFSPSNSNRTKIFFHLDNSDPLIASGYQILLGENGSSDAVTIGKLINGSFFPLVKGKEAAISNDPSTVRISIVFRQKDLFNVKLDYNIDGIYDDFLTYNDVPDVNDSIKYLGIDCLYSETRKDKFVFDNLYLDFPYQDTVPPNIYSTKVLNNRQVQLVFNEPLDAGSVLRLTNYHSDLLGSPVSATLDTTQFSTVTITYDKKFVSGRSYNLDIMHIEDKEGNVISDTTVAFIFIDAPQLGDIVISEILFDPYPNRHDFVELYNRTDYPLLLQDCTLKNFSNNQVTDITGAIIIQAHDYIALTTDSASTVDLYLPSNTSSIRNQDLPAFNNDKGVVAILNKNDVLLDSFQYYDDLHLLINDTKSVEGVSLEKIDLMPFYNDRYNWFSADKSHYYASPGYANSHSKDYLPPHLMQWHTIGENSVLLSFDDAMNISSIENIQNYTGLLIRSCQFLNGIANEVIVHLIEDLDKTEDHPLTLRNLKDKNGNALKDTTIVIRVGHQPLVGELVLSEVLFNPNSGGEDFIEIYNPSEKRLQLQGLIIRNIDNGQETTITKDYVLLPGTQVALTSDLSTQTDLYIIPDTARLLLSELPALNADIGTVEVYNADQTLLDSFTYNENIHLLLIDKEDVKGVSLEKLHLQAFANDRNNWHSSARVYNYATPGFKNSNYTDLSLSDVGFSLQKKVFSPNGDGIDDLLILEYNLESPGYIANIEIYNSEGYKVKNLSKNELLGTKGFVSWDGTNEDGAIERLGIYILKGNIYNTSGRVIPFKKDCVLADYIH